MKRLCVISASLLSLAALGAVVWRAAPSSGALRADAALALEDEDLEDGGERAARQLVGAPITKAPSCVRGILPFSAPPHTAVGQRRWQHVARLSPGIEYMVFSMMNCGDCSIDSTMRGAIDMVRAAGVKVLYHLDLWGGYRQLNDVQGEVQQWMGNGVNPSLQMDVDGVFVETVANIPSYAANLAGVANYVRSFNASGKQPVVVYGTAGFHTTDWALNAGGGDVLVSQGTYWFYWWHPSLFLTHFGQPAWYQSADRNRLGHWFSDWFGGSGVDMPMTRIPDRNVKYIALHNGNYAHVPTWTKRMAAYAANSLGC
jgi:hypothetical protein